MKKSIKRGLIILTVLVIVIVYFVLENVHKESLYKDSIEVLISPSNEECDTYNVLWKVDSLFNNSYDFIKGEYIYLANSKMEYSDSSIISYRVFGKLYKNKRSEHYLECTHTWVFSDSLVVQ